MTFGDALILATRHGESLAEQHPDGEKPPTRLPPELVDAFDDWRREALIGRAREAFWMRRWYALRYEYGRLQRRLEDRA